MPQDDEPQMTRMGIFDTQVCVPKYYSDEQAIAFAEKKYPCGTTGGWQIIREGSSRHGGDPERVQCDERSNYIHIALEA